MTKATFFDNISNDDFVGDFFNEYLHESYTDDEIKAMTSDELDTLRWNLNSMNEAAEYEETLNCLFEFMWQHGNYYIAKGAASRWDGDSDGYLISGGYSGDYTDFEDMYYAILKDCDYVSIKRSRHNTLLIRGIHHDGETSAEIKLLTDKGYDFIEDQNGYEYGKSLKRVWNSTVYSAPFERDFTIF